MINQRINQQILEVWTKFRNDSDDVTPLFYPEFKHNSLAFVGCNPSFNAKGFKQITSGDSALETLTPEFFRWRTADKSEEYVNKCTEFENQSFSKHQYFKKLQTICNRLGLPFQHLDLFIYKETSQSKLKKTVFEKKNLNDFGKAQLAIFKECLSIIDPKAIVVVNALAASIIKEEFNIKKLDEETGHHYMDLNGKKVPIFFSSMLSGQRALDVHSLERLEWHIRKALR